MASQWGGSPDGHELDEVVYIILGDWRCRNCGGYLGPYTTPDCIPQDWKTAADVPAHFLAAYSDPRADGILRSSLKERENHGFRGIR